MDCQKPWHSGRLSPSSESEVRVATRPQPQGPPSECVGFSKEARTLGDGSFNYQAPKLPPLSPAWWHPIRCLGLASAFHYRQQCVIPRKSFGAWRGPVRVWTGLSVRLPRKVSRIAREGWEGCEERGFNGWCLNARGRKLGKQETWLEMGKPRRGVYEETDPDVDHGEQTPWTLMFEGFNIELHCMIRHFKRSITRMPNTCKRGHSQSFTSMRED